MAPEVLVTKLVSLKLDSSIGTLSTAPGVKAVGCAHALVETAIMPISGTTSATPKRLLARPIPVSFVSIFFPALCLFLFLRFLAFDFSFHPGTSEWSHFQRTGLSGIKEGGKWFFTKIIFFSQVARMAPNCGGYAPADSLNLFWNHTV
jgi:hypothetical protein